MTMGILLKMSVETDMPLTALDPVRDKPRPSGGGGCQGMNFVDNDFGSIHLDPDRVTMFLPHV